MSLKKISSRKRKFIELLKTSSPDELNPAEVTEDIGISIPTYYRWIKSKEIWKIVERENAVEFGARLPKILRILIKKAEEGDIKAIKLYLERYDSNKPLIEKQEELTPDDVINIIRKSMRKESSQSEEFDD